jgi:mannosyltransferase OCH1-like enzyme
MIINKNTKLKQYKINNIILNNTTTYEQTKYNDFKEYIQNKKLKSTENDKNILEKREFERIMTYKEAQLQKRVDFLLNKEQQILEKENQILEKENQILEKENQILEKENQILEKEKQILLNKGKEIPLNIFQTWSSLNLPPIMKANHELLKTQNPEFKFHLYDDNMCREFIKNNFEDDILYAFDKIKPGAFKADLWRYCILYIKGGIYLDIKFQCVNNFKLISLTQKEYYVRDIPHDSNDGIYQAIMVNLPSNNFLLQAIKDIVYNCKHNIYTENYLGFSGPGLFGSFFNKETINSFELYNGFNKVMKNNKLLLIEYVEYREEQKKYQTTRHYAEMWNCKEIFNYPTIKPKNQKEFSNKINKNNIYLYPTKPTIIETTNNDYLLHTEWKSYFYNEDGSKNNDNLDKKYKKVYNSIYFIESELNNKREEHFIEDININVLKVVKIRNSIYYIAHYKEYEKTYLLSDKLNITDISYNLNKNKILLNDNIDIDKTNLTLFEYKNNVCVIYDWFPLKIGKINYESNTIDIVKITNDIPDYFNSAIVSTSGYTNNNEIWFVLQKSQQTTDLHSVNYQHFFAVFDLDMSLLRYSELFKLHDCRVENCSGLIVKDKKIILSYSILNRKCFVAEYDKENINNSIKWYNY